MGRTEVGDWVQCGREFSTEEIREIRETVAWLPGLARGELAATVCEHKDCRRLLCAGPLAGGIVQ
jgi:hypothetical protein